MTTTHCTTLFDDKRLDTRRLQLEQDFIQSQNCSIHKTCQDYSAVRAAYRFLANDKVTEQALAADLVNDCSDRVKGKDVIAFCDTSTLNIDSHKSRLTDTTGLGPIGSTNDYKHLGLLFHPILVHERSSGAALGISAVKLWSRSNKAIRKKSRRYETKDIVIEQKESIKWIDPCIESRDGVLRKANHITFVMDREGDIMEVLDRIPDQRTDVLVRVMHNRNVTTPDQGREKLYDYIARQSVAAKSTVEVKDRKRKKRTAEVDIRFAKCKLHWSQRQKVSYKNTPEGVEVTVIEVRETVHQGYDDEPPLIWRLITTKDIDTAEQAKEEVRIYEQRWRVEEFFKLLKSDGYNIKSIELTTGKAIRKLLLILMKTSIKILQLKAARDGKTDMKVSDVFDQDEIECLQIVNEQVSGNTQKQRNPYDPNNLGWATWIIARLGGWSEFYNKSRPPGNKTLMWGMDKFEGIMIGFNISRKKDVC